MIEHWAFPSRAMAGRIGAARAKTSRAWIVRQALSMKH
jgi:hypothetical protein